MTARSRRKSQAERANVWTLGGGVGFGATRVRGVQARGAGMPMGNFWAWRKRDGAGEHRNLHRNPEQAGVTRARSPDTEATEAGRVFGEMNSGAGLGVRGEQAPKE